MDRAARPPGGFLDAAGGGGWGLIVTSNLLIQGATPRKVIGTVNTAEFFLTVTISATFILALGFTAAGLIRRHRRRLHTCRVVGLLVRSASHAHSAYGTRRLVIARRSFRVEKIAPPAV